MIPPHAAPTARIVATGLLVAVAVIASMLALTELVLPGPWVRTGVTGILLVSATAVAVRAAVEARARRTGTAGGGSVVPTLAGGLVALWYVLSRYGAPTSEPDVLVGPAHLSRVVERLGDAAHIVQSEVAPVPGTLPMALLTVGGSLAVLLLADALAGGLHWPAATGLPLLALWAPPLVLAGQIPRDVFVVVVAALLLLLTVPAPGRGPDPRDRPPAPVRRAERARALLTTATAVVVAVTAGLVASASGALPGYAGAWYQAFTTTGDSIQLAEDLDVLSSLTERSDEVVLTYTGPETAVGPLRTYTASAFDGRRWQRGEERSGEPFTSEDLLWPDEPGGGSTGDRHDLDLTVGSLRDDQLPVPVEPRQVAAEGTWGYDMIRDEVVGDRTDAGDTYAVGVLPRLLDAEVLRSAGTGTAVDAYLEVPDTEHADEVTALAAEVTSEAPTAYDQAVALQDWLRDPSTFTYSTQLPRGGTGDPVWDFLQHRTGYCVQFATTMAVMARTLDIPSRLGVGFLPGDAVETEEDAPTTTRRVTGQDSHAWPELYFEGVGWVRFEPTPAVQTGAPPEHTVTTVDPAEQPAVPPQEVPTAVPEQPQDVDEPQPAASEPVVALGDGSTGTSPWVWVGAGAGLLVVVLAGLWVLHSRRRDDGPVDAERAWRQVVTALERDGVRLPPRTTPRSAPDAVSEAITRVHGRTPTPEVRDGLRTLSDAVERSRYAAPDEEAPDAPVDLSEVADQVVRGLSGRDR